MKNYKVLISGASSGFGASIARELASMGDEIILLARRKERLDALKEELGDKVIGIIACDICDKSTLARVIKEFEEQNYIDVLVNNAGLALGLESADMALWQDWERMISVNVEGLCFLTHLLLPSMVQRGYGHVVNIGSIAGSYAYPGGNVYGATKAFVKQFSLNLRADLYDKNIRISDIEPGLACGSEFSLVRFKGNKQKADELYKGAKALRPEDIAKSVAWVIHLPEHVNINRLEIMPTTQAPSSLNVHKVKE